MLYISYRNQSFDMQGKSNDWFLCECNTELKCVKSLLDIFMIFLWHSKANMIYFCWSNSRILVVTGFNHITSIPFCSKSKHMKGIQAFAESVTRSSPPEVFLEKYILKICSKFTGERPCGSAISVKLQSNFIEVTLRHRCSRVNLLHISEHLWRAASVLNYYNES